MKCHWVHESHFMASTMPRNIWATQNQLHVLFCLCVGFLFVMLFNWFVCFDFIVFYAYWRDRREYTHKMKWVGRCGEAGGAGIGETIKIHYTFYQHCLLSLPYHRITGSCTVDKKHRHNF